MERDQKEKAREQGEEKVTVQEGNAGKHAVKID